MEGASRFTERYAAAVLAPLDREEATAATALALDVVLRDRTVQRDRLRVFGPTLRIEKPRRRNGAPRRMIWVRVRDRDRGVVHEVSVEAGAVVEHVVDANANPPVSDEERDEAYRLIAADPRLGELVRRDDVEIEWFNPGGHGRGRLLGARLVRVEDHRVVEDIAETEIELDEGVLRRERGQ